jgi:uncharacterized protein YdgA (DUF945 family)
MKRLIMATMVTAILASSTVWAADNAPVAAQQQTQQVQQTQKTAWHGSGPTVAYVNGLMLKGWITLNAHKCKIAA